MKKIGRGTKREIPQFLKQGLTIYKYEEKEQEEIAALIKNRVADFERIHEGYKFEKLIFGFEDEGPDQHFEMKFILEK